MLAERDIPLHKVVETVEDLGEPGRPAVATGGHGLRVGSVETLAIAGASPRGMQAAGHGTILLIRDP